jgi:hypothetical protein
MHPIQKELVSFETNSLLAITATVLSLAQILHLERTQTKEASWKCLATVFMEEMSQYFHQHRGVGLIKFNISLVIHSLRN